MEQMQTDEQNLPNGTQPKMDRYDKVKRSLKIASGVVALFCIFAALASIVALYLGVIRGFDSSGNTTSEQGGAILGLVLMGIILAIGMVIVAISCLAAGLLIITNKNNNRTKFIIAAVIGIFEIIAIILISVCGSAASVLNGQWYYAFIVPFAADLVLRVVCAILCSVLKEKQNG